MKSITILFFFLLIPNFLHSADKGSRSPIVQRIKMESQKNPGNVDVPVFSTSMTKKNSRNDSLKKDLSKSSSQVTPKSTKVKIPNQ